MLRLVASSGTFAFCYELRLVDSSGCTLYWMNSLEHALFVVSFCCERRLVDPFGRTLYCVNMEQFSFCYELRVVASSGSRVYCGSSLAAFSFR